MTNINKEIINIMQDLVQSKKMFTVHDVTRIIRNTVKTPINHDDVRMWVELYFFTNKFSGLKRKIGYHLPYYPPPQVYYQGDQDIINYDPDALDPNKITNTKPNFVSAVVYALVEKSTGLVVKNYSGRGGEFYLTRQGPNQMLRKKSNPQDYEVAEYKITL